MIVKTDNNDFNRDTNSMALLNSNRSAKEEYFAKAKMMQIQKTEIARINTEIDSLKTDISDIKSMLIQLLADKN